MKEIEKVDPKQAFLEQFNNSFDYDFLPKEWNQEKRDRVAKEVTPSRVKTGMVTSIPMICKGEKCSFKDNCKLFQENAHPLNFPCPYELGMVRVLMAEYVDKLEVDINDIVEFCQIRDLVNLEVQEMRSAKFLAKLYKRYGDWGKVCGYYNTGKPIINDYAHYAVNNKNYKSKWVEVEL